jgi:ribose transport system substrate-binding protein
MKKRLFAGVLAAAMVMGMSMTAMAEESVKVGFALKTLNGPYFVALNDGLQAACDSRGWELTTLVADEDIAKEAENLETFIAQGMDIIFFNSIDPDACIPMVDAVAEAGIPLINLDSATNSTTHVTTCYSPNEQNGYLSGLVYADWLKEKGKEAEGVKAVLASGAKGNVAGYERRGGLFAGIVQGLSGCTEDEAWAARDDIENQLIDKGTAEYDLGANGKFEIVGQGWGMWTVDDGLVAVEDFIVANPDINCVLGENDQMLFGAMIALENAGLEGVAIVAAADGAIEAFDLIKENETAVNPYIVSGLNSPWLVAEGGAAVADEILAGAAWDSFDKVTLTAAAGVNINNVDEWYEFGF